MLKKGLVAVLATVAGALAVTTIAEATVSVSRAEISDCGCGSRDERGPSNG